MDFGGLTLWPVQGKLTWPPFCRAWLPECGERWNGRVWHPKSAQRALAWPELAVHILCIAAALRRTPTPEAEP